MGKTKRLLKIRFKDIIVFILLLVLSGCFKQYRMDFNLQKQALISCDERINIKNVSIIEADNYGFIYQLRLKENSKGSHILYLARENESYDTGTNFNSYLD